MLNLFFIISVLLYAKRMETAEPPEPLIFQHLAFSFLLSALRSSWPGDEAFVSSRVYSWFFQSSQLKMNFRYL